MEHGEHHDFQVRTSSKPFSMAKKLIQQNLVVKSAGSKSKLKFLVSMQWIWFPSFPSSPETIVAWKNPLKKQPSSWIEVQLLRHILWGGPMDPRSTFFHQAARLQNTQQKTVLQSLGPPLK